jgi:hypothetical protein
MRVSLKTTARTCILLNIIATLQWPTRRGSRLVAAVNARVELMCTAETDHVYPAQVNREGCSQQANGMKAGKNLIFKTGVLCNTTAISCLLT